MRRWKHKPWYVEVDDHRNISEEKFRKFEDFFCWTIKRTMKSAWRCAQERANKTGETFVFYKRRGKNAKKPYSSSRSSWVCYPEERDCFLEML
jgi:hypothetical protein